MCFFSFHESGEFIEISFSHRLNKNMPSHLTVQILSRLLICLNSVSPCHENAEKSQTYRNIWLLLRVMDGLPQVAVGGGSHGLYGPWKFKRVNTCRYTTTGCGSWRRGTWQHLRKTQRSFHIKKIYIISEFKLSTGSSEQKL